MPYLYATALDWSFGRCVTSIYLSKVMYVEKLTSVAAHVQADTIPDAMRPGLTLRDALLNSSEFLGEYAVYRAWIAVRHIIKALKNSPMPEYR
jgi:hypothetical protein